MRLILASALILSCGVFSRILDPRCVPDTKAAAIRAEHRKIHEHMIMGNISLVS